MSERKLIVFPDFGFEPGALTIRTHHSLHPLLRRSLLYWDRIEIPNPVVISMNTSAEIAALEVAGVVSRTMFGEPFVPSEPDLARELQQYYMRTLFFAFEKLSREEPGVWSLAQQASNFHLPAELAEEARTVQVELYNLLPAPADDTAFDKILGFRQRRPSEMLALRAALDELYQGIISSPDGAHAREAARARVQKACGDAWRSMNESFVARLIPSIKVELNLGRIAGGVAAGIAAAPGVGLPTVISAAAGAAVSALNVQWGLGRVPKGDGASDFAYIHSVIRDVV